MGSGHAKVWLAVVASSRTGDGGEGFGFGVVGMQVEELGVVMVVEEVAVAVGQQRARLERQQPCHKGSSNRKESVDGRWNTGEKRNENETERKRKRSMCV